MASSFERDQYVDEVIQLLAGVFARNHEIESIPLQVRPGYFTKGGRILAASNCVSVCRSLSAGWMQCNRLGRENPERCDGFRSALLT
jgi:hypothetical protein